MKALVPSLTDVRKIELLEQEIAMKPNQVLVKTMCIAPSQGTALHMYRGDHLEVDNVREARPFPYPWNQGFSYGIGRVEDVGSEVSGFKAGDLVHSMRLLSDLSVISPADLLPVPDGLDPEAAALVFQAGVALHGIRRADIALGDTALVTGQGTIGVFAAQLCKLAGAWRVIATDLSDKKLVVSRQVGVDFTINAASEDVPRRVMELTGGSGADVVAEVSGSGKALVDCSKAAAPLATVASLGWTMDEFTVRPAEDFAAKALEWVLCFRGRATNGNWRQRYQRMLGGASTNDMMREDWRFIFDLMLDGRLKSKELATHRFPLKDLVKAWEFIDKRPNEYVQVLLVN